MKTLITKESIVYKVLWLVAIGSTLYLWSCCKEKFENSSPVAIISADVTEGNRPLEVTFSASQSFDPDEDELTYYWDFGDGTNSNEDYYPKVFNETGSFNVKLKVTDPGGLEATDNVTIKVNKPPDLFPISENAQWIYKVTARDTENGKLSDYDEGTLCLVVTELNNESQDIQFIKLRVTGERYYNNKGYGEYILISHVPGKKVGVYHILNNTFEDGGYKTMINMAENTWSGFGMFFSNTSTQSVTQSTTSINMGLGNYSAYKIRYHSDNIGENYVSERYDVTEEEYYNPQFGLLYRTTSRYVDFLDCFTCPVYGGGTEIELTGYYIVLSDGTKLEGGTGYNPGNPYGGNMGLLTVWNKIDLGYTSIYLDGDYVGTIQKYFPDGISCDDGNAVNVFRPEGTYTLTAESPKGYKWETEIEFKQGECLSLEFIVSNKSIKIHNNQIVLAPLN
ncbi:PKD domain-containing protein [Saccharicrinis sp. FJH54]|uniref:PKD domain-containing protein n=1 Tax=Saccharicrinis sp. FJH54 TaxID=3344665 RepID=UPI0035D443D3